MSDPVEDVDAQRQAQDAGTMAQMESLREEAKEARAIGCLEPIRPDKSSSSDGAKSCFLQEFEAGSLFAQKVDALPFRLLRRCRRDGNCFYRSYLFGLFHGMCTDVAFRKRIRTLLDSSLAYCEAAGYDRFAIEEMHEELMEVLNGVFKDVDTPVDVAEVEKLFQSDDMNYPICFFRCLTSSFMKQNKDDFLPFLTMYTTIQAFCMSEVDPLWREADELQVQALCRYFEVPARIFYLDQSPGTACTIHELLFGQATSRIDFLYRPGHYELLYDPC
ncbi:unnamed protein product [Amoebophrya sp. A25]|nr:unnamed protein product [Amoebophrya sp. A25]|eukprot:GSA25T00002385001.1